MSSCLPKSESQELPNNQGERQEVISRYATVADWNAGALTIGGGQAYLAYEPTSSDFSIYTIEHVIRSQRHAFQSLTVNVPDGDNLVPALQITDINLRFRREDHDVCVEIPLTFDQRNFLVTNFRLNPYLRLYEHPKLEVGAYVASPRYDLLSIEGRRAWTIYRVIDIATHYLHVEKVSGSLCHGRSGGPNILIENPDDHDGRIVPILSKKGRCIVVGVSEQGVRGTNYHDQYRNRCYFGMLLSRPILAT